MSRGPPAVFSPWAELPALLLVYPLVTDLWFFCAHRLMHHRLLYARFHKMHHRFKAPEAICGLYCTPVEMMFVNACALMSGPVLLGSHPYTWGLWAAVSLNSVAMSHSGYTQVGAEGHDLHHLVFNANYGVVLPHIWDRLYGSYFDAYLDFRKYKKRSVA